jgi:hypothetical protein
MVAVEFTVTRAMAVICFCPATLGRGRRVQTM